MVKIRSQLLLLHVCNVTFTFKAVGNSFSLLDWKFKLLFLSPSTRISKYMERYFRRSLVNKFLNTDSVLNHVLDHKAELCNCLPLKGDSEGTGTEVTAKQLPV